MSPPLISIVVPNLNKVHFIEERINSIKTQTLESWECILIDGYSNDGSWEVIQDLCLSDSRFLLFQYPPQGIYDAWNIGIKKARGEFIYIATSDDTMSEDCLAKMVAELQDNEACDVAQCALQIIDESGNLSEQVKWDRFPVQEYLGDLAHTKHIRYAPHDAVLQSVLGIVYSSITQVLIRSEVFNKIGYFGEDLGAIADWEWEYRVSLNCNVIYIPEKLATWRMISNGQATEFDSILKPKRRLQLVSMQRRALKRPIGMYGLLFKTKLKVVTKAYRQEAYDLFRRSGERSLTFHMVMEFWDLILVDLFGRLITTPKTNNGANKFTKTDRLFKCLDLNQSDLIKKY